MDSDQKKNNHQTLFTDCLLLTGVPGAKAINHGAMLVKKDTISDVGRQKDLEKKYPEVKRHSLKNRLVMPGLVNTHIHLNMSILRGLAEDLPLQEWLDKTYQFRQNYLDDETQLLGVRLSLAESLKHGVTTIGDMSFYQYRFVNKIIDSGIRAVLYDTIMDVYLESERTREILDFISGTYPERITPAAGLHAPYSTTPELMEWFKREIIDNTTVPYNIHLAETKKEIDDFEKMFSKTSTAWLDDYDFLSERLLAVHCVWLNDADIELLAVNKTGVSHNPESNMKLGAGITPVEKIIDSGIHVGLGTDGAASNNDLDLFSEMDTAGKLQKVTQLEPCALPADKIVQMATLGGAKALGLGNKIGSLEPGKQADFITIDLNQPHLRPVYELNAMLCYSTTGADVRDVWIEGKQVMEERELLSIDEEELLTDIRKANHKINRLRKKQKTD